MEATCGRWPGADIVRNKPGNVPPYEQQCPWGKRREADLTDDECVMVPVVVHARLPRLVRWCGMSQRNQRAEERGEERARHHPDRTPS
jgi:hypothetical protein